MNQSTTVINLRNNTYMLRTTICRRTCMCVPFMHAHPLLFINRCNEALVKFNELQAQGFRIQHRFPSCAATSYRDFALTVNHSRSTTRLLMSYAKTTRAEILEMKTNLMIRPEYSENHGIHCFSFHMCGCCLRHNVLHTNLMKWGIIAWGLCVATWLSLSSALFAVKAAFWPVPVVCQRGFSNSSNHT